MVLKVPTAGRPAGACYRLLRAVGSGRGLSVLADDDSAPPAAAAVGTLERWAPLVVRLLPCMRR